MTKQGLSFPVSRFVAGERLSPVQFARALDLDDPLMTSSSAARAAGLRGRAVTPAMLGFHLSVSGDDLVNTLGFTWGRTLNLGIDVDWAGRAVTEEDLIECRTSVVSTWERAARDGRVRQFARLRTEFGVDGRQVCRCEVLFTELRAGELDPCVPDESRDADSAEFPYAGGPPPEFGDDELPEHRAPAATRLSLAQVSVATDNPDPLHLDDDVARAAGFPSVVGHGATVVALLHEPVRRRVGLGEPTRLATRQQASFGLGDSLAVRGRLTQRSASTVECQTSVVDQSGREIGSAHLRIGVPSGPVHAIRTGSAQHG